jgi:hypothetical protein
MWHTEPSSSRASLRSPFKRMFFHAAVALLLSPGALVASTAPSTVTVYKSPYCGCCKHWVTHMEEAGFVLKVVETQDLATQRRKLRMPEQLASCHVAQVGGYALEGHVPASEVRALLQQRPAIRGISVPGMTANAPGMGESSAAPAFNVMQVHMDGSSSKFSTWPRKPTR